MAEPFSESDLLPISALQHLIYCPRQCALIHNEQLWAENRLTVEGKQLHDKAHDDSRSESRPGVRIVRGLRLRSFRLGIWGIADVVEFPLNDQTRAPAAPPPPVPIEYKRGRPKKHDADRVQLCAQALCLEEMLGLPTGENAGAITTGELFYGKTRRRQTVPFDSALRSRTADIARQLHTLCDAGTTPPAAYEKHKCDRCSLLSLCMPKQIGPRKSAARRFDKLLHASIAEP